MSRGALALVGSGEYLEAMAGLEASLLVGRPPRYVQIATAAVPDGPRVVAKWWRLGGEQARRLGVTAVTIDIASRDDANNPEVVEQIRGAGLIYLSGGKPDFLATTLRATLAATVIEEEWHGGAALAGCSAGAMVMAPTVPHIRRLGESETLGLNWTPHLRVIPHFDYFIGSDDTKVMDVLHSREDAVVACGVDEMTALVHRDQEWRVAGEGCATLVIDGVIQRFSDGELIPLPRLN